MAAVTLTGTVYEDINYGGGSGRNKATALASGGSGRSGARVELYDASGFVGATTTDVNGVYAFSEIAAGQYAVRVVCGSVTSGRTGYTAASIPVLTYVTTASTGTVVGVTDWVGGMDPATADAGNIASGTLDPITGALSSGGKANAFAPVNADLLDINGLDFGFNFNTVTNVNDAGQGSLRQTIANSNLLGNEGNLNVSGHSGFQGKEFIIFMISNGTTGSGGAWSMTGGLRTANNYFTAIGGTFARDVATINLNAPITVSAGSNCVLDVQGQPGWTGHPIIHLNGSNAGVNANGLVGSSSSTIRGMIVSGFSGDGIRTAPASGFNIYGCWIGLSPFGNIAGNGNGIYATNGQYISVVGNVISGNNGHGIYGSVNHVSISGNHIGTDPSGLLPRGNANCGIQMNVVGTISIGSKTNATMGNVISGNGSHAIELNGVAASSGLSSVVCQKIR